MRRKKYLQLITAGLMCLAVHVPVGIRAKSNSQPVLAWERTTNDLPDDFLSNQIHVMYVLPSDGVDQNLDTNGTLARSVAAFQKWLVGQTSTQLLRLDTYGGALDITFFRLSRTDAQIASHGAFVRDQIEAELISAGFNHPNKIYAVYYGGGSTFACGGAAWPPTLPGKVAAQYLKGTPPGGAAPCASNPFASSEDNPGYWEFGMLHEILHTMGIVATCAPHHTLSGHVSDSPTDLMYAGSLPWQPSVLDVGRDDYFRHNNPSCLNLANSPYMTSTSTPLMLTEINTNRAIALDSVTMSRAPFTIVTGRNFSGDQRVRIMLFATNVLLQPGENTSVITVQLEDSQHRVFPLTVEYVGMVPNFDWLTQINVRLPNELVNSNENVWVTISLRGVPANRALVGITPSQ
jgi:hypothetical protein